MMRSTFRVLAFLAVAFAVTAASGAVATASAPPVGALPAGPSSTIQTQKGQLVAFALPTRSGGRVWRVARPFDGKIVEQVTEGNVGATVVLVFRAKAAGTTTVVFGLTRGERAKAYESRRFTVQVR